MAGAAPTGRQVTTVGTTTSRIAGDKIVEDWADWDELGVLQQIGAIQMPALAAR